MSDDIKPDEHVSMNPKHRWPTIVLLILAVTVAVNVAFIWLALHDEGGGFTVIENSQRDSSYKMKIPLHTEGSENGCRTSAGVETECGK